MEIWENEPQIVLFLKKKKKRILKYFTQLLGNFMFYVYSFFKKMKISFIWLWQEFDSVKYYFASKEEKARHKDYFERNFPYPGIIYL